MVIDDIYTYLTNLNLVNGNTGWLCYESYFPDDQDQMVGLFETPGLPGWTQQSETERVAFQLRVRGTHLAYGLARAKWQQLFNAIQDSRPTSDYALIQTVHYGPMTFNDDRGRPNLISNFRVIKRNND